MCIGNLCSHKIRCSCAFRRYSIDQQEQRKTEYSGWASSTAWCVPVSVLRTLHCFLLLILSFIVNYASRIFSITIVTPSFALSHPYDTAH